MVRASRNILGPAHVFSPTPHTWLEIDLLLFWLPGSDLRLGRPAILGPLDLRDCRDTGPSPSSRKSSVSRVDCTEQSCESQTYLAVSITQYLESHHHQETQPHRGQPSALCPATAQMCPCLLLPSRKTKCKPWAPSQVCSRALRDVPYLLPGPRRVEGRSDSITDLEAAEPSSPLSRDMAKASPKMGKPKAGEQSGEHPHLRAP